MKFVNVAMLLLLSLGMSLGQVLFKVAADHAKKTMANGFVQSLVTNGYFFLACAVYAVLTLLWVWILTRVPLSRAYPFLVLAFVFTPAFAVFILDEAVNFWYGIGLALVISGLVILVWKAN